MSIPRHIAIVMDGNGRWAQRRHLPRKLGHREGQKAVRATVEHCRERGVESLTLFAFSSENWSRPDEEVGALMQLFVKALDSEVDELDRNGVRLNFVGDLERFDVELAARMRAAMARTAGNIALRLNIAVNYGGRWDIAQAARSLAAAALRGELAIEAIDEDLLGRHTCLAEQAPVDLFIRTGGEVRVSNFLLWQIAYAELYFSPVLWPDFDAAALDAAIDTFARRERRFGQTSAQVRATG
ncbi:MAG: di-trans,poly-cis-decaprenylcistransferase [Dokdonella sp.]|uniref:polyprenyl diphosphate synthase n=1 Tax=Dokdonella sp. TaxID=2291710 RepID=UPI0025BDDC2E|nr:polyprenyl diphosphate synthase [Dokdonella sp.]MBZ0222962.1 di-trans,poly-cis-decaprenylcistransferase [Dokdonella sp.]MCC7256240.1 di-trans,poly-cis-decaprenylcistransferase [Dokdonella sp.]